MAYFAREQPAQQYQPPPQFQPQSHQQPQHHQSHRQHLVRENPQPTAGATRRDQVYEQKRQRHEQRKAQRHGGGRGGGGAAVALAPAPAPAPMMAQPQRPMMAQPQRHVADPSAGFDPGPASRAHLPPGGSFGTSGRAGSRKPRREATVTSSSAVRHVVAPRPVAQHRVPMGRDELEKQRLADRTGGFHQYEGGAQPVGSTAPDDGRFGYDFASEEAARRQAANARKQHIYAAQRSEGMAREQHNASRSGGNAGAVLQDTSNHPQYAMQHQHQHQQHQHRHHQPQHGRRSASREAAPSTAPYASIDHYPAAVPQGQPQYGRRSDSRGMDCARAPPSSSGSGSGYVPRGHTSVRMHAPPGGASQITFG